jgi:hypothetical protein
MNLEEQIDQWRKEYGDFLAKLGESRREPVMTEAWRDWCIKNNATYYDAAYAKIPVEGYEYDINYRNGIFSVRKLSARIDENYNVSIDLYASKTYEYTTYQDLDNVLNEEKIFIKRMNELKNLLHLQGDF